MYKRKRTVAAHPQAAPRPLIVRKTAAARAANERSNLRGRCRFDRLDNGRIVVLGFDARRNWPHPH
jgi:hypothetical protein